MSGFFGVFSPSGNIDCHAFGQMQRTIQTDGYEELETHLDEHIAMGHLMLRVTPESNYDKQPLRSSCGRYLLVGHFRLDYRDELGDKLGLTQKELDLTPDSVLVMLAYQKWADQCVHHIEGDWVFVIYDYVENSLQCIRDKFGTSALFYSIGRGCLFFSSCLESFQNFDIKAEQIDFHQIYRLSFDGIEMESGHTLLKSVFRQSPSTIVYVGQNLKINYFSYYRFQRKESVQYKFEEDYVFSFLSFFSIAIKSKIRGVDKVGIFQSSGLDSNSILYFLANEMKYRAGYVYTYTSCNAYQKEIEEKYHPYVSDDLLFKDSLVMYSNVKTRFLDFRELNLEDEFKESISDFDNPIVTKSKFWLKGILKHAKEDGVQMMFTGQLGNFTITWNQPNGLVHKLIKFKFKDVVNDLICISRLSKVPIHMVFIEHILMPLKSFIRLWIQKRYATWQKSIHKSSLFNSAIGRDIDLREELKNDLSILNLPSILSPHELRKSILKINAEVTGARWYSAGFKKGIVINDPTIDAKLVQFLFNVPESLYFFNGRQKYLFRKAFSNRIFNPILQNNFIILQSFDLPYRMKSTSFISNYIKNLKLELIENSKLSIDSIERDYIEIFAKPTGLQRYIASVKFLKKFSILYLYVELTKNAQRQKKY